MHTFKEIYCYTSAVTAEDESLPFLLPVLLVQVQKKNPFISCCQFITIILYQLGMLFYWLA